VRQPRERESVSANSRRPDVLLRHTSSLFFTLVINAMMFFLFFFHLFNVKATETTTKRTTKFAQRCFLFLLVQWCFAQWNAPRKSEHFLAVFVWVDPIGIVVMFFPRFLFFFRDVLSNENEKHQKKGTG
tara:strand:+ start:88 stop:474 length:387 start_codon:yes stop_codon:yes gene_type:complete